MFQIKMMKKMFAFKLFGLPLKEITMQPKIIFTIRRLRFLPE